MSRSCEMVSLIGRKIEMDSDMYISLFTEL